MSDIFTTAVPPTDTEPWRVRIRVDNTAPRLTDLPNPGADPAARHAEAVLALTGFGQVWRVRDTPRGFVFRDGPPPFPYQTAYTMTDNQAREVAGANAKEADDE